MQLSAAPLQRPSPTMLVRRPMQYAQQSIMNADEVSNPLDINQLQGGFQREDEAGSTIQLEQAMQYGDERRTLRMGRGPRSS